MSCINIDRVAPKTFKTEALCPIDRQSVFVNLKADEKSHGTFIFLTCFPSGQQSYLWLLSWRIAERDVMYSIFCYFIKISHDIIVIFYLYICIWRCNSSSIASSFLSRTTKDFRVNEVTGEEKAVFLKHRPQPINIKAACSPLSR